MGLMPKQANAYALTHVPISVIQTAHVRVRPTASTNAMRMEHAYPLRAVIMASTKTLVLVYAQMVAKMDVIIKVKNAYAYPHVLVDAMN